MAEFTRDEIDATNRLFQPTAHDKAQWRAHALNAYKRMLKKIAMERLSGEHTVEPELQMRWCERARKIHNFTEEEIND